ncbi:MAG: leucine-rich repeat protein [Clostridia bacterium]|nr:leucine-rich repeat protein [Clostridia bacterium]
MKKLLSVLLIVCFLLPNSAMISYAASTYTSGYYTYTVSSGKATIDSVSDDISGAVTIPSTLGGYTVKAIANASSQSDGAFYRCTDITSITIPSTITNIGDYAFAWCTGMKSVTIPSSVTRVGKCAFTYCRSLESVNVPDSVTSLGGAAFNSCSSLKSATIGSGIKVIDTDTFRFCSSLESFVVPGSVTSIGAYAFASCTSLQTIEIPSSVTSIGEKAFSGSNNVTIKCEAGSYAEQYAKEQGLSTDTSGIQSAPNPVQIGIGGDATINIYKAVSWAEGEAAILGKGEAHTKLDDVIVEYKDKRNNTKRDIANSTYKISLEDTKYGVTLIKNGYQDYIIPSEVFSAFQYSQTADLDIYMRDDKKDGKPYVSSVYGRESGKKAVFTDLSHKELKVVEKETYDIVLSAGNTKGKKITYAIGQDVFHQVSNSSGVFSSQDLYRELSDQTSKKIYAFIVSSDGVDTQEIKLKKFLTTDEDTILNTLDDGKISLLGKDGFNLTISGTGFIDGMEFSLDAFKDLPIGFEKDGSKYKVSLGLDLFSAKNETKGSSTTGTKYKDDWEFKTFKDEVKDLKRTCSEAFKDWKDDQSSKKKAYEKAKSIRDKYDKKVSKVKSREKGFEVSFLGYWEFEILDGGKLVTTDIGGTLTGKFEFTYTQNGFVWVIPEYTYFAFSVTLSASINGARTVPDYNLPLELNISVNLIPKLQVGGGIGWKDIASAGFWGSAELNVLIEFMKHHTTGDVTGKFGYEATFLYIFGTKKTLLEGTLHLWDRHWGSSKKSAKAIQTNPLIGSSSSVVSSGETEIEPTDRTYITSTSQWLGDKIEKNNNKKSKSLSSGGVEFKTLQTGVFEYAQSQVVAVGNKLVMVYIEDASNRDEYNRMRLMSTVYNPTTNMWSAPVAVCDDGYNDVYPSLASDGNKVYVTWQKICKTLTVQNSNTAESIIKNSEIYISEYNISTDKFNNAKRITNNSVYDYSPKIAVSNGTPTVYYASCLNNDMSKTSNNTISKYSGSTVSIQASSLNYIHNIVVSSNGKQAAYLMDKDGIVSDGSDVSAYVIGSTSKEISIDKAIGDIAYAKIDGVETLLFTDQSYIYYYDNENELHSVYVGTSDIAGGFYPFETTEGLGILWSVNNGDGSNSLWGMSYADGEWSESVCLSEQSDKLSSITVTALNGKMYGVVSATQVDYSEETGVAKGETALKSFRFTDFTDISIINTVAFEEDFAAGQAGYFDVYVKNNGTTNVNSITFTVSDTLGTYSTQTISVELPSGSTQIVTLIYPVPTNYTSTELTIVASTNSIDAKQEDNSYSIEIGNPDLYFGDVVVSEYGSGYIVETKLYNASDIPAENALLFIKYNSKDSNAAESYECNALEKNQAIPIALTIKYEDLVFDEDNCAFVYLFIGNDEDNAVPVLLVKTNDVSCGHTYTTQNELFQPTCTENGISEICCIDCGKTLETIEQNALGHSFTNYIYNNDATTEADGTETAKCDRCDVLNTRTAVGTIIGVNLQSISIKTTPNNTTYYVGETLNTAGLVLTATYSDSSSKDITSGFTCNPTKLTTAGQQTITVTYQGKTTYFTVTVSSTTQGKVKSVSISNMTIGYKSSANLRPQITADSGASYTVTYSSSNPSVVSVDNSGRVTSNKTFGFTPGSAVITCKVTDSNGNSVTDTCLVTVNFSTMQWIIKILLFGWLWY